MQVLGEQIFAKTPDGGLVSRVGTMFFRTPGLVTRRGVHAMQRAMWIEHLDEERAAAGLQPLTDSEIDEEFERFRKPAIREQNYLTADGRLMP